MDTALDDRYVLRPEFAMYCKSVNGDLADLKTNLSALDGKIDARFREMLEHFDNVAIENRTNEKTAALVAKNDTQQALATAQASVKDALHGTMSRSYAIIITILTGVTLGSLGTLLGHVLTHH